MRDITCLFLSIPVAVEPSRQWSVMSAGGEQPMGPTADGAERGECFCLG
jgi:hypothetical protein